MPNTSSSRSYGFYDSYARHDSCDYHDTYCSHIGFIEVPKFLFAHNRLEVEYSKAVSSLAKTGSWPAAQPSAPALSTASSGITIGSSHGHNEWPRDVRPLTRPFYHRVGGGLQRSLPFHDFSLRITAAKTTREIDLVPTPGPIVFGVPQIGRRSISDFIESLTFTITFTTVYHSTIKAANGQGQATVIPVTVVTTGILVPIPTNQVDPPGVTISDRQGNTAITVASTIGALVLTVGLVAWFFFRKHRWRKVDPFLINDPEPAGETASAVSPAGSCNSLYRPLPSNHRAKYDCRLSSRQCRGPVQHHSRSKQYVWNYCCRKWDRVNGKPE
ncbi:hypothetical protein C8J57DRAFT_413708 [Mycena rebaudengoi]|nr:hypothetical protein C8J57DRAFT_413708 [Mycena rebaudengoi]